MSLVRVDMIKGKSSEYKKAVFDLDAAKDFL